MKEKRTIFKKIINVIAKIIGTTILICMIPFLFIGLMAFSVISLLDFFKMI